MRAGLAIIDGWQGHCKLVAIVLKGRRWQGLGHEVDGHVLCWDMGEFDGARLDLLTDEMVGQVDVLDARVLDRIYCMKWRSERYGAEGDGKELQRRAQRTRGLSGRRQYADAPAAACSALSQTLGETRGAKSHPPLQCGSVTDGDRAVHAWRVSAQ